MANITQKITNFPTPPNSSNDTPTEFNTKADAFVNHQGGVYAPEVNTWATQANALKDEVNAIKTDIDSIVATIPSGTINDATTTTTSVWSSAKVDSVKQDKDSNWGIQSDAYSTKFPDGTLIYRDSVTFGFSSNGFTEVNFNPIAPFTSNPCLSMSFSTNATAGTSAKWQAGVSKTIVSDNGKVGWRVRYSGTPDTTITGIVYLTAIGRWK